MICLLCPEIKAFRALYAHLSLWPICAGSPETREGQIPRTAREGSRLVLPLRPQVKPDFLLWTAPHWRFRNSNGAAGAEQGER